MQWSSASKFGRQDLIYGRELMSGMQADRARDVPVSAGRSRAGVGASDSEDVEDSESDEERARALACRPTFFHADSDVGACWRSRLVQLVMGMSERVD